MPALLRVVWADPHEAVHAPLALQPSVSQAPVDLKRHALQPGLFTLGLVEDLSPISVALGPTQIHPQQHLGPILALGPAGAGVHRYDRRPLVVRLVEHHPSLPAP